MLKKSNDRSPPVTCRSFVRAPDISACASMTYVECPAQSAAPNGASSSLEEEDEEGRMRFLIHIMPDDTIVIITRGTTAPVDIAIDYASRCDAADNE